MIIKPHPIITCFSISEQSSSWMSSSSKDSHSIPSSSFSYKCVFIFLSIKKAMNIDNATTLLFVFVFYLFFYFVIRRNSGVTPYKGVFPSHLSINCLYKISLVKPLDAIIACWVFNSSSSLRFLCSIIC